MRMQIWMSGAIVLLIGIIAYTYQQTILGVPQGGRLLHRHQREYRPQGRPARRIGADGGLRRETALPAPTYSNVNTTFPAWPAVMSSIALANSVKCIVCVTTGERSRSPAPKIFAI